MTDDGRKVMAIAHMAQRPGELKKKGGGVYILKMITKLLYVTRNDDTISFAIRVL
jgi:hypothetical protein